MDFDDDSSNAIVEGTIYLENHGYCAPLKMGVWAKMGNWARSMRLFGPRCVLCVFCVLSVEQDVFKPIVS